MGLTVAAIAAIWGFGEATLFFLVPDIYLTLVAVRDARTALRACAFAVGGALLGGLLMYLWGATDLPAAEAAVSAVPGVSPHMIQGVRASLNGSGVLAVFLGPIAGTPYKIFAIESGGLGLALPAFLLISVPARWIRFVLLTAIAGWLARGPLARQSLNRRRLLGLLLWSGFYVVYFSMKGI